MSADCKRPRCRYSDGSSIRQSAGGSASSDVLDFVAARAERLTEQILVQPGRRGGAVTRYAADVGDVELWRRAARRAGRVLNVHPCAPGSPRMARRSWVVSKL